jgi:hypothetical protein
MMTRGPDCPHRVTHTDPASKKPPVDALGNEVSILTADCLSAHRRCRRRTVGLFAVVLMGAGTVQAVVSELQNNKATVVAAFDDDIQNEVCSGLAQILVDGTAVPPGGSTIDFNENTLGLGGFAVGIDRVLDGLTKGPHVVEVQIRSGTAGDQLTSDKGHLTVMSFK